MGKIIESRTDLLQINSIEAVIANKSEVLRLCAKAAGVEVAHVYESQGIVVRSSGKTWDPMSFSRDMATLLESTKLDAGKACRSFLGANLIEALGDADATKVAICLEAASLGLEPEKETDKVY